MTQPKGKSSISGSSNRDLNDKAFDIISSKDFGGLSDGATDDTNAINTAISSLSTSGIVILPRGTVYTEASLVMDSDVILFDFSRAGKLRILTKDEGNTLPILKGGLEIKSQGKDGVILRAHDNGVSNNPFIELLNSTNGQLAGLWLSFLQISQFVDIPEISTPTAPAANFGRLFVKDDGAGKTQLCIRFNTGATQVIATEP